MHFFAFALLLAISPAVADAPTATAPQATIALRAAIGAVLRGQGADARSRLEAVAVKDLDAKDRKFRECALSRLSADDPVALPASGAAAQPFVRNLLLIYQTYWRNSAMDESKRPEAERALVSGLGRLLGQPTLTSVDDAEPLISSRLRENGLYSQEGRTGVLHDLMIWGKDTQRVESVPLPEGQNETRVNYLDAFLSRGWSSYFTCDRTGTGGWTTSEGLFVIVPSYDSLTDETFRVSFLAHESQHYSDKKRFGTMASWRLEYRAKLVELAYAETTKDHLLDVFSSNQGDDTSDPHSFADKRVLQALERRLGVSSVENLHSEPVARLQQAAVDELKADTAILSKGAASPVDASIPKAGGS